MEDTMAVVTPSVANHCVGTDINNEPDIRLKCRKSDGTNTCATWRLFYVQCPKVNQSCSSMSSAWVPAITVCNQNLW
jgi:hypothetical protein